MLVATFSAQVIERKLEWEQESKNTCFSGYCNQHCQRPIRLKNSLLLWLWLIIFYYQQNLKLSLLGSSLRKQPTCGDATTGFPTKWRLRNEHRNSILMTHHYPDLGSAPDWLNQISHTARTIRTTTKIWVVTCHQYGISALVSQTSFGREMSGSITKMLAVFSR